MHNRASSLFVLFFSGECSKANATQQVFFLLRCPMSGRCTAEQLLWNHFVLFRNHCHAALDLFTDPRASHRVPLRRFVVSTRVRFTMQRSVAQCGIDFRDLLLDPSRSSILLANAQSTFDCATKNSFILCSSSRWWPTTWCSRLLNPRSCSVLLQRCR